METIKCPVCGEENDASLDNCQYCHQPLRQSTSELNGGGMLIDSGQSPTVKKTSELEATLPAWLKNARQGNKDEAEQEAPAPAPASPPPIEESAPATAEPSPLEDWLSGLDDDEDEDEEAADWLMNLQGGAALEKKEAPSNLPAADEPITAGDIPRPSDEEEAPIGTGELPGWVSDLQGKSSSEESESLPDLFAEKETPQGNIVDTGDAESGELPDWLASLSQSSDSPPAPAETPSFEPAPPLQADSNSSGLDANEPTPDWMTGLQASSFTERAAEESASEIPSDDLPDWISGSGDVAPAAAESLSIESDLPDWMTSDAETAAEEPASESLPDWISDSADESSSAPVTEPTEAPLSTEGNLDDWMENLDAAEESAPAMAESPAEEEISMAGDLPDWMAELRPTEESAPAMAESPAEEEISMAGDLPDWMASLKPAGESASVEAESETSIEGDIPDWLSSLPSVEDGKEDDSLLGDAFEEQASVQTFEAEAPSTEEAERADVPDWLSQLEPSASLTEKKAETPAFAEPADTPDWLEEMPAIETSGAEAVPSTNAAFVASDDFSADADADNEEIFGIDMPDWLSTLGPEDVDDEESAEAEPTHAEGEVSGAELPSWVQAMRPVADVVPGSRSSDEQVVGTGPLAGLSGVLPAATNLGQINNPKANAIKLRVSESQQSSATMLEELLASESQPSSFKTPARASSVPIVRWLIAILLFLAIGSSLFIRSEMVSSPDIEAEVPEIQNVINNINEFPAEKAVLLIFDYEAGFSGEMKAVAAPLVDQLMSRGAKLAVISTSPTGPALAENFLGETQANYEFQAGVNYRNLGYLPGGASGMLSFIANPRSAILAKEDEKLIWDIAPLKNIARFSDFGLVIILTNDVEKGRAWVEQSAATLDDADTPLLMAISAQAEPILYPYYLSGQVDGLVSGLSGGATYEQMRSQKGLGKKYWDSYSIGLLLAEILIVIGAMINFLAALRARQKRQKEEN